MQDQEIIDLIDDLQGVGLCSRTPKDLFKFLAETRGTLWVGHVTISSKLTKEGFLDPSKLVIPKFLNEYREAIEEVWNDRRSKHRGEARSFGLTYTMGYRVSHRIDLHIGVRLGGA